MLKEKDEETRARGLKDFGERGEAPSIDDEGKEDAEKEVGPAEMNQEEEAAARVACRWRWEFHARWLAGKAGRELDTGARWREVDGGLKEGGSMMSRRESGVGMSSRNQGESRELIAAGPGDYVEDQIDLGRVRQKQWRKSTEHGGADADREGSRSSSQQGNTRRRGDVGTRDEGRRDLSSGFGDRDVGGSRRREEIGVGERRAKLGVEADGARRI